MLDIILISKRALGLWDAHQRIAVYKGLRKHSSSKSPAINFNRSANSLKIYMKMIPLIMFTKLTGCKTSTFLYISLCKTSDLQEGTNLTLRDMIEQTWQRFTR